MLSVRPDDNICSDEFKTTSANWRVAQAALGRNPEESFSPKSSDNLLTQQLLNPRYLSKEPVNLHQISAVAMLA